MHATIHPLPLLLPTASDLDAVVAEVLPRGSRPAGTIVTVALDGNGGRAVALWPDEDAPEDAYRVVDRFGGAAAGRAPLFAELVWLNGGGDPAVAAAAERGGRERIHPAIGDLEGLVAGLVLRSADHRIVVVTLAAGREVVEEVHDRIERSELLPGEDPALLPGPDRTELGRVLRAELPVQVQA